MVHNIQSVEQPLSECSVSEVVSILQLLIEFLGASLWVVYDYNLSKQIFLLHYMNRSHF